MTTRRRAFAFRAFIAGLCAAMVLLVAPPLHAQPADDYNYHRPNELMVTYGRQALMLCNGLFVSDRTVEQVYEQELKLYRQPVLPPDQVTIDRERRAIAVGGNGNGPVPVMRAAHREGVERFHGCSPLPLHGSHARLEDPRP